jgi:hypothetical protein
LTVTGATTGQLRDRVYDPGKSVGELIQELSEVIGGFDWDVVSPSLDSLVLRIHYPAKGGVKAVILSWGDALLAKVSRSWSSARTGNAVRVTGRVA